jgi:putative ABC transport system permease protein
MLWHHIRQACRVIVREPAFSVAVILTLALGVGANVAVFAVVEAVLLKPLPYARADELVILNHRDRRTGIKKEFVAIGDYVDLAARQTGFETLDAYGGGPVTIFGEGEPLTVNGLSATPGLFNTLRVTTVLGRPFTTDDARQGAARVAILGYEVWQEHYRGDPAVIGRSIKVGNQQYQIVGVAPPAFRFPPSQERTGIIVPMSVPSAAPSERKSGWVFAVGRLKNGVHFEQAAANLGAIAEALEREHPSQNQGSEYLPVSLRESLIGDTQQPLLLMLAAVAVVLLVACANVANLLLSRALGRTREMAVRTALGAGRGQLAMQVLVESLVLALIAGAAGVAFAYAGTPALVALVPRSVGLPALREVGINWSVLGFALAVTIATAFVFGLAGALATRWRPLGALGTRGEAGAGRVARRAASVLVVAEVALAIVLLVGAGLILRSFARLLAVDPGFRTDHVLTMNVSLPGDRYRTPEARQAFYERAFPALEQQAGVEAVGAAVVTPLTGNNWTVPFERADRPVAAGERPPDVGWQLASGDYFRALRIPLIAGRLFDERDGPKAPPVVIISAAVQQQFFGNENPVGMRVRLGQETAEIVGVVGDIRRAGLTDRPRADMYFSFEHAPAPGVTLFVRTTGEPVAARAALTSSLRAIEPQVVVGETSTLSAIAAESMGTTRLMLWLLGLFAIVALALATIGVYGVMSYSVRQHTREIGTRMALGATGSNILWNVLRQGLSLTAIGVTIGLVVALVAMQSLAALLYGVSATDAPTLATACGVLGLATLTACYLPARRAARVDPARTLDAG